MNIRPMIFITVCIILLLSACSSPEVYSSEPLTESTIYVAEGIDNARIQFLWLELPDPIKPGAADVRLFLAKIEPPEPTIPNPNELQCKLSSTNEYVILGPERILFEFREDGTFLGSYTYKACPECIECYMNWDYTLEISGSISKETVFLDIAIQHIGHNVQGSFVSAELALASNSNKEPRISCNRTIECKEIVFVTRK
ncbi:hypothetical protein ACFLV7_10495 [Chloroflexota bacterium]